MSPTTNPVTLSLNVMVTGMGDTLVGSVAVEETITVGATLSNVKPVRVAVPPGVVTDTLPELPPPTTAEI
jgi:hypothetical protein